VGGKKRAAALKRERFGNKIEDILRGNSIESEISGILPGLQLCSSRESQNESEGMWQSDISDKYHTFECKRVMEGSTTSEMYLRCKVGLCPWILNEVVTL
jgi:hypothetical protein